MDKKQVGNWCDALKDAWMAKDFERIAGIFPKTSLYYEDPFSTPGTTTGEIVAYWDEIVHQEINNLLIEPMVIEGFRATLHWYIDYRDIRDSSIYIMDGVYLVEFNECMECIFFKQWWVIKE